MLNFESNPNPFKSSIQNIVTTMQDQSSLSQILLAQVFTLVFHFERKVDTLKS